jgi:hypothetical protein
MKLLGWGQERCKELKVETNTEPDPRADGRFGSQREKWQAAARIEAN